jgi:hypothetical protein
MDDRLPPLNDSVIFQIVRAMNLPQNKLTQEIIRLLFGRATLRFSKLALELDHEVGQRGTMAGARWLLQHFIRRHEAAGTELIPKYGPLLIVSNHPASYDGMVISAYVPRSDYRIIVGEIPPYQFLPNLSRHIIFSPPVKNTFGRMQTVRHAVRHLKDGGALLIFPRGNIEPDPAFMPNPDAEFHLWSRSLEIFLRSVPQTRVLVTVVSGVISQQAFRHPITWFRRSRADRQRLAFMYQIIRQVLSKEELFGLQSRVTFGELIEGNGHETTAAEIETAAKRTMTRHLSMA